MKLKILLPVIVVFSVGANAGNAWYWGTVTKINTIQSDGSFQVNLDNADIKTFCTYDRVDFKVQDMGAERTKLAFSLALSAFASGKKWGVVVDLPSSESNCSASATAGQGAGIR